VAVVESVRHRALGALDGIVLAGEELEATVVPAAGMIGCSLRHRGEELLVQRGGLEGWQGTGRSFGIPLLHPWANRLRDWSYAAAGRRVELARGSGPVRADEHGLPIHGALGAAPDWRVVDEGVDPDGARLVATLDYAARPARLAAFPYPHALTLAVRLAGDTLSLALTLTAGAPTGQAADPSAAPDVRDPLARPGVPIAFGWHPWLSLPGVPRADWVLGLPDREELVLDAQGLPTGERIARAAEAAPLGDRVLDHHAATAEDAAFSLAGPGRRIDVRWTGGYRFAQVFAPAALDVCCLEPMTAPVAALSDGAGLRLAAPGEAFTAGFAIRVSG
jgi:galactose mutarotase-like enzyme